MFLLSPFFKLHASVDYQGYNISSYNFTDSQYDGKDFSNSNFSNVIAEGTRFSSSKVARNFSGSNFTGAYLKDANFSYGNMNNTNLSNATLYRTYFISTSLAGANFSGATITFATFTSTVSLGFTAEQLYSTASYANKNLQGVSLELNNMDLWVFSGQDLTGAKFSTSSVKNADFRDTNLATSIFDAADLSGADFRGAANIGSWNACITQNTILADGSVYNGSISLSGSQKSLVIRPSSVSAVKVSAESSVSDGASLVFKDKSNSGDNAMISVSGEGVSFDLSGAKLSVYFADDFEADQGTFISLIEASDGAGIVVSGLDKGDVSLFDSSGNTFASQWQLVASESQVGILVAVPECAHAGLFAALGGCALLFIARRKAALGKHV